ncbi:MAG: hypothetical protein ACREPY_03470 [Rhodanobacteraceae bacterium]
MRSIASGIQLAVGIQRRQPEAGSLDKLATSIWLALQAIGCAYVRYGIRLRSRVPFPDEAGKRPWNDGMII